MKYYLYTNNSTTRQLLIYLYDKNKDKVTSGDVYNNSQIGSFSFVDWENSLDISFIGIGLTKGWIDLQDGDLEFRIKVNYFVEGDISNTPKLLLVNDYKHPPDFLRQVILDFGLRDDSIITTLIKKAKEYVENRIKSLITSKPNAIKKYIYNAEDMYWELMNSTIIRSYDSLFLKKDDKTKLFEYVKDFFTDETKAEYEKYNMPYKCNVLLYGKPGTGKTSTVLAIASFLNMNVGLIPVSKGLDDTGLIHALNSVKKNDCKIIVLEDIDCLFTNRKANDTDKNSLTLSGLLNCLDGLFRNDGILLFMTANNISFIDDAILRSNRIDYKLYYDYADKQQVQQCFDYYFKDKGADFRKLWNHIECKNVTVSMLQAFFFKNRKNKDIMSALSDLDEIINGVKEETKDSVNSLYM